jgi:hypothetical protein
VQHLRAEPSAPRSLPSSVLGLAHLGVYVYRSRLDEERMAPVHEFRIGVPAVASTNTRPPSIGPPTACPVQAESEPTPRIMSLNSLLSMSNEP